MQPKNIDSDIQKGAQETERPDEISQSDLNNQLPLRTNSSLLQETENDYPEPGSSPEHSGQLKKKA
jgi:hypothetical protein